MDKLYIIKIGGQIIDQPVKLSSFLQDLADLEGKKILVHGGGMLASQMAEQLQVPQLLVEGRRITDAATLRFVTMVYAGYINKNIVAGLQARGCNALGLTGADGNSVQAHKRTGAAMDYGFAGDVDEVNVKLLSALLEMNITPVLAPITHDRKGQLLNTNADTLAQETATALGKNYEVHLVYSFEKAGVLMDTEDASSVIRQINPGYYAELKQKGLVFAGMIPKLDNAFQALSRGVTRVIIGPAEELPQLINGKKGTSIVH
jgi:acetylglutamate kinase